jgi:hypothetical protein
MKRLIPLILALTVGIPAAIALWAPFQALTQTSAVIDWTVGLAARWKMDVIAGDRLADMSGNNIHGTSVDGVWTNQTWPNGTVGGWLFDAGASGDYLSFGGHAQLNAITNVAHMGWWYPNKPPSFVDSVLADRGYHHNGGWNLYFENDIRNANADLRYRQDWTTTDGHWSIDTGVATNIFHHVAVNYDGSATGNDAAIWWQSAKPTVSEISTPAGNLLMSNDIAAYYANGIAGTVEFQGVVGELFIYDAGVHGALTGAEITNHYTSGTIPAASGLILHAPNTNGTSRHGKAQTACIILMAQNSLRLRIAR